MQETTEKPPEQVRMTEGDMATCGEILGFSAAVGLYFPAAFALFLFRELLICKAERDELARICLANSPGKGS